MASIDNPRFPHKVEILRAEYDQHGSTIKDENGDEILNKVFESECGLRDLTRSVDPNAEVIDADYKLALPRTPFIFDKRDTLLFTHSYTGEVIKGIISDAKTFNLGTNIWFKWNGNG